MATGAEDIVAGVAANGFPVVVAAYLLVRMEKELQALRLSIDTLRHCKACTFRTEGKCQREDTSS